MAKKSAKGDLYDKWSEKTSIKDKSAFESVKKVRDAYERSKAYLRSSSFWDAYQIDTTGGMSGGGNWYDRRTLQEKMALMYYVKSSIDDFVSNIKSPMARGRINTFVNWMKKVNIEFGSRPNNKADRNASFMAEKVINYWMQNSNVKQTLGDCWEDLAVYGNAFLKLSYVCEYKNYTFPVTKAKDVSEEDKKDIEDGDKKTKYGKPQETVILDDVVIEHVPIREIYPDPQGRNLHGDTYRAGWIIRKRYVTVEYVNAIYSDHPDAKYLDEVKPASAYRDMSDYFFEPPTDNMNEDIVELLEMEDQDNDKYYVLANDVPIIDGVPLPANHKEISYHKLDFIRVPGQFFSMGICDLLENIQSSYEVALNMVAEYVYRTYNYKLLVESDNFGEITQSMQRAGDMFVPIDTSDGRPLNSKIMPLVVSPIGFDIFSFLELLEKQATLATNIDPAQMAMLAGSKTATSDILNKELLMTMIGGVIENNVNGDLRNIGRQLWKLQQQHYTKQKVKKIIGDDGKETTKLTNKTLRFDGIEIKLNDDGILEEKEIEGDYSFFELEDKFMSTKDEIDIFVRPESKEVTSQALDEQNIEKEFAQLMPFAVDPNNPQQVSMHPMPMVDATKLFTEYFDVKRLPHDLLINKTGDNSKAVKDAQRDITAILNGENTESIPGQSSIYLEYMYKVYDALMFKAEEIQKKIEKDMQTQMKQVEALMAQIPPELIDPMNPIQPPQPEPDPKMAEDLGDVEEKIEAFEKHLLISSMPASLRNSRIMMMQNGGGAPAPADPNMAMEAPMSPNGAPQMSPDMINSGMAGPMPMGGGGPMPTPNPMLQTAA